MVKVTFIILAVLATLQYTAGQGALPYTIRAVSTEYPGSPATNVYPSNTDTSKMWNGVFPNQGQGQPTWLTVDLGSYFAYVTSFSLTSTGDNTHDTRLFGLFAGLSVNGPWRKVQDYTAQTGTGAEQFFSVPATTARYWKFRITNTATGSNWQPYVRRVNFFGNYSSSALLHEFTVADYSLQYEAPNVNGFANNQLPLNNPLPDKRVIWNAQVSGSTGNTGWAVYDLGAPVKVNKFLLATGADYTHDAKRFELDYSTGLAGGPWNTALLTDHSTPTNYQEIDAKVQTYNFASPVTARYWLFTIINTQSEYQPYVAYVNFGIVP